MIEAHLEQPAKLRAARITLAAIFLTIGAGIAALLIHHKPKAEIRTGFARVPDVAVEVVSPVDFDVPVTTFGTVRAKTKLAIIPQVSGQLVYAHKQLAQGMTIPKGELLFEIDRTIYEARVRQVEAEVKGLESELDRLDQEAVNLGYRIETADAVLAIDEADYTMSKKLYEQDKVGTHRDLDMVYQKYLRQKDVVIQLKNGRAMIPHTKLATQAKLDAARARVTQAKYNLKNTRIFCPFKARVESVNAKESQVVAAHLSIATLTDMDALELSVGVDPRDLRWLAKEITPCALGDIQEKKRPTALVQWSVDKEHHNWRGIVTRFERVDEATRTARLVVEVHDLELDGQVTISGDGPSTTMLSIGMYCRVELPTQQLAGALVVPRHAIHEDKWVYVFEPDDTGDGTTGTIAIRQVPMLRTTDNDDVLVDYQGRTGTRVCELKPGERVIVSTLTRASAGMKVSTHAELFTQKSPEINQPHHPKKTSSRLILAHNFAN